MDLPYELALPTFAATAWYHKKLPDEQAALEPLLKDVEDLRNRWSALSSRWEPVERQEKKQRVDREKTHEYIGLPVDYHLKANLRVSGPEFTKN